MEEEEGEGKREVRPVPRYRFSTAKQIFDKHTANTPYVPNHIINTK